MNVAPDLTTNSTMTFQQVLANQLSFRVAMVGLGDQLVICLHGFPESAVSWRYQLAPLAQAGYRVWAPDLRGYAGTTRPANMEAYHIDQLMRDVSGLLDAAQVERVILIGHDWGGLIAWYYAMRYRSRVERLIILNAPHPACFERELRHWRQFRRSWYAGAFQLPWLPEAVLRAGHGYLIQKIFERTVVHHEQVSKEIIELYREQACEPGALTAMLHYYRATIRGGGATHQRHLGYPTIDIPTLVIWGLQDLALTRHNLDGLEGLVTNLSIITHADAGHFVHQDKPEQVTHDILTWLQDQPP
jgi:pimeloyl-ACP methyl ester carboxylesterase